MCLIYNYEKDQVNLAFKNMENSSKNTRSEICSKISHRIVIISIHTLPPPDLATVFCQQNSSTPVLNLFCLQHIKAIPSEILGMMTLFTVIIHQGCWGYCYCLSDTTLAIASGQVEP